MFDSVYWKNKVTHWAKICFELSIFNNWLFFFNMQLDHRCRNFDEYFWDWTWKCEQFWVFWPCIWHLYNDQLIWSNFSIYDWKQRKIAFSVWTWFPVWTNFLQLKLKIRQELACRYGIKRAYFISNVCYL